MREKVYILDVGIDKVTVNEAGQKIWDFLETDKLHMIFTPNSEMIMLTKTDEELKTVLNSGDLTIADGIGVIYASKIIGNPLQERVTGYDTAQRLVAKLPEKGYSLYLLGGVPGVAQTAKENLEKQYPGIRIVGTHDGYFDTEEEQNIIDEINRLSPDIVFVCLGMSRQEKWIYNHRHTLNAKVCMGIGGSLDVFAGKVQRAPDFYCKYGLEWFYRLMKEPWRYKRMMALPKFAFTVIKEKVRK